MSQQADQDEWLQEYRLIDRLHWEKLAEEMRLDSVINNIQQNARRFLLVNVQWASFATGALSIFVVTIISLAVLICCWLQTKGPGIPSSCPLLPLPLSRVPEFQPLRQPPDTLRHGKCSSGIPPCFQDVAIPAPYRLWPGFQMWWLPRVSNATDCQQGQGPGWVSPRSSRPTLSIKVHRVVWWARAGCPSSTDKAGPDSNLYTSASLPFFLPNKVPQCSFGNRVRHKVCKWGCRNKWCHLAINQKDPS